MICPKNTMPRVATAAERETESVIAQSGRMRDNGVLPLTMRGFTAAGSSFGLMGLLFLSGGLMRVGDIEGRMRMGKDSLPANKQKRCDFAIWCNTFRTHTSKPILLGYFCPPLLTLCLVCTL